MENIFHLNDLFTTLSNWMLGLVPVGGGLMLGYHGFMSTLAQDDAQAAAHKRAMRNVLVGTGLAEGAALLVRFLLSYVG